MQSSDNQRLTFDNDFALQPYTTQESQNVPKVGEKFYNKSKSAAQKENAPHEAG